MKRNKLRFKVITFVLCLVFISLPVGNVYAYPFNPAVNYQVGLDPSALAVGDFNKDGKPDLVVTNFGGDNVSILMGSGNGTFAEAVNHKVGSGPVSVAVGDFDGDGIHDLAVVNYNNHNVSIRLGKNSGGFQLAVNYAVGTWPLSIAIGDFDGDGDLDLAVANFHSNNVSILLGNGDGTFAKAQNYAAGSGPRAVAVGDFNGDGNPDLVVANVNGNNVSILIGVGDGTFSVPASNFSTGKEPRSVAVGDFNGNGNLDLAVANYNSKNVSVLLGGGNGTFASAVHYGVGANPHSVAVGDFNGNGNIDLAVANYFGNNVSVLLGNGNGIFAAAIHHGSGLYPVSVAVGDFNGNGNPCLAVANYLSNTVSIMLNAAPPTVTSLAPDSGIQGHTIATVITGTNFTGATAVNFGADVTINSLIVDSAEQISANITIESTAATGFRDVSVTTPAGTGTFSGGFNVKEAPIVTTVAASVLAPVSATLNMTYTTGEFTPEVRFAYRKTGDSAWTESSWVSDPGSPYALPVSGLDSNTTYDFKAQLKYNSTEIEGNTLQFTTDPLTDVIQLSPGSGQAVSGADVTFQWEATPGATKYYLQIMRLYDGQVHYQGDVDNVTQYTSGSFPANGTEYRWRVVAGNALGWGSFSTATWRTFVSGTPTSPADVVQLTPAHNGAAPGTDVTFTWETMPNATNYFLQILRLSDNQVHFQLGVGNQTSYTVTGFPDDGQEYRWRVVAGNSSAGWGNWSTANWRVMVSGTPTAPPDVTLVSPADGSDAAGASITFTWEAAPWATQYYLQVLRASDNTPHFQASVGNNTSFTVGSFPDDGTVYKWRVVAGNQSAGWGSWATATWWNVTNQ